MIIKNLRYILMFIFLLLLTNKSVLANTIDFSKTGSIQVELNELTSGKGIENAEITVYQIATIYSKNNNLSFEYVEKLNGCRASLDNLENPNLASEINKCIVDKDIIKYSKTTNKSGKVKFNDMPLSLYLVKQTNDVEGYSTISPFLVIIPKVTDNLWTYNIVATPKTDIISLFDLTVEKEWIIPSSEIIPEFVTIELYKNSELIDTIKLSQENNWTYTWKQIEKRDDYIIKEVNIPKDYKVVYSQNDNTWVVTNTKKLAQTGQNIYLPICLLISGMLSITLGIISIRKSKNVQN